MKAIEPAVDDLYTLTEKSPSSPDDDRRYQAGPKGTQVTGTQYQGTAGKDGNDGVTGKDGT
jgi:hypothetical protein